MPQKRFSVHGVSETPARIVVNARQFKIIIDEPPALGGEDKGANPVEYLLSSLAGCINVVAHLIAKEMGIKIKRLEIQIYGDLNTDGLQGKKTPERAGFQNISVNLKIDSDADSATLGRWLAAVEDRCPVSDNIANPTPVKIGFQKL
jgi:uncharacterized OsmC-like protein